jgi:hypothetical protein
MSTFSDATTSLNLEVFFEKRYYKGVSFSTFKKMLLNLDN